MIRKLNIINENGSIDHAHFLFYFSIITSIVFSESMLVISFLSSILIVVREFLDKKSDEKLLAYKERLDSIESDLTALKIGEGIKVLR